MRGEAAPWWRQAVADLHAARRNLHHGLAFVGSWFAQQAVERALKAVYIDRYRRLAPRTHDLEFLGVELRVPGAVETELVYLNPAFDTVRYPDPVTGRAPVDEITLSAAQQDVSAAERVLEWARNQLGV